MKVLTDEVFAVLCFKCDKPTIIAPCEHCGEENPVGTLDQARTPNCRRRAAGLLPPLPPMTAPELAKLAIAVLDAQKRYFKIRNREDMLESMKLEKQLRTAAEGVLYGK